MGIQVTNIPYVNETELIEWFEELTGWSSDKYGAWNSDQTKLCFFIARDENSLQYEQDWVSLYCPSNYEHVTSDKESLKKADMEVSIGEMLQFLILNNELDVHDFFYVGTKRF